MAANIMDLLITYDIDTSTPQGQRRLRKVAKICEAYGLRVQKSVFEVVCQEPDKIKLTAALSNTIDHDTDNIRIYRLPAGSLDTVEHIGLDRDIDPRGTLII